MMDDAQADLDWVAFRFGANELSESERDEFEEQLATDQNAREAVARMVAQTTAVARAIDREGALPTTAAIDREAWAPRTIRWSVVGLGSCLALLVAILASSHHGSSRPEVVDSSPVAGTEQAPGDLALVWAEMRQPQHSLTDVLADLSEFGDSAVSLDTDDPDLEGALSPPSWMMAAVARMDQSDEAGMGLQE